MHFETHHGGKGAKEDWMMPVRIVGRTVRPWMCPDMDVSRHTFVFIESQT
jgi:hypothetical protein